MLVFVCNCIENGLHNKKKKYKLDKKLLCLEIYQKVFTLTDKEKEQISNSIEFLCQNKMIDVIPLFKKYGTIFLHYVKSKLWDSINIRVIISQLIQLYYAKLIKYILVSKIGLNPAVVGLVLLILWKLFS